jgi:hypothetical protein
VSEKSDVQLEPVGTYLAELDEKDVFFVAVELLFISQERRGHGDKPSVVGYPMQRNRN